MRESHNLAHIFSCISVDLLTSLQVMYLLFKQQDSSSWLSDSDPESGDEGKDGTVKGK